MRLKTSSPEAFRLKKEGQKLYNEGFQQKEIAIALSISERTITKWAKAGEWKEKRNEKLDIGLSPLLAKFIEFIMDKKPSLIKELETLQAEFRTRGKAK